MKLDNYWILRIKQIKLENSKYSNYDKYITNLNNDSKILEIWPWNWDFSYYIKEKFNLKDNNVYMSDLSSSVISNLKEQLETQKFNLYLIDSIELLKTLDNKFDLIIIRHVLEHMKKDYINDLIPLLLDKLNIWWKIIVEVPNIWNFPYWFYASFADYTHITQFTYESLVESFLFNSTEKIEIKTFNLYEVFKIWIIDLSVIKSIIWYIAISLSTIFSFIIFRVQWDRFWTWQVFTRFILMIVTKK